MATKSKSTKSAAQPQSVSPAANEAALTSARTQRMRGLTPNLDTPQHEGELELARQRALAADADITALDPLDPNASLAAQGYPVASLVQGDVGNAGQHTARQRRKQRIRFTGTSVGTEPGTIEQDIQDVVADQGGGNPLIPQNTPPSS